MIRRVQLFNGASGTKYEIEKVEVSNSLMLSSLTLLIIILVSQ